jgi:hypothetical protein
VATRPKMREKGKWAAGLFFSNFSNKDLILKPRIQILLNQI